MNSLSKSQLCSIDTLLEEKRENLGLNIRLHTSKQSCLIN